MNGFQLTSVSKAYGNHIVLRELTLTFAPGENTAILGPSGCGKSTMLRLLAGLDVPSAGQINLDGRPVSQPKMIILPPHARSVSMVFQDLALWPNLTVMGNVRLGLSGMTLERKEREGRAAEALQLCGIHELADRRPGTLSGGQQQRVALARALAVQPRYLLLDEPFSGLDLITKLRLLEDIRSLAKERHFTVLLVCHDPMEAWTLCRFAVTLEQGKVRESGPLLELLASPKSELLRVFRDHLPKSDSLRR
ncbi:MAG: ABC transporter ATP-binding protein [Gemmataceae bacterium]|nr:ABC transporter ATP-binding protein [Gemmataceae bacterium]MCI0740918.1 ABC transporter ATP-binding protein [Gemmataceae bacterium]